MGFAKRVLVPIIMVNLISFVATIAMKNPAFSGGWLSPVQLTHNSISDQVPIMNADGTIISYYSNEDGDDDIYIMEYQDGTWQPSQKITFNSTSDTMPTINNYGDKIAYIGGEPDDRSIYFVEFSDVTWKQPIKITDNSLKDYFPSINSDGTKITFQSKDEQGKRSIRFIEFTEGKWSNPITLPHPTDNNMFPEINSDGTKTCFHAEESGYRNIYFSEYIENTWSDPIILTEDDEQNVQVSINSDGTKIVYYWTGEDFASHVTPEAVADIRLLEYKQASWQPPITIAGSSLYEFDPTISGGGTRVAYSESNPGHPDNIYAVEYKDGIWQKPENLTRNVTSGFRPNINNNGDKIVYYGTSVMDSDFEVYLLSYDSTAGSISGKVTTSPDSNPLESVLISADPGGYLSTTDGTGSYVLNVPSGSYTITAVADCFESSSKMDVTVEKGGITEQNFSLSYGNCFPYPPVNPSPSNGASDQPVISILSWEGSDPEQDPLTYDVLLGVSTEHHIQLDLVSSNQNDNFYVTGLLDPSTTYFWQVIAKDDKGGESTGSLWKFTTISCPLISLVKGNPEDITTLRNFRDRFLKSNVDGMGYIEWYYKYSTEVLYIIASSLHLRENTSKIIDELIPEIKSLLKGQRTHLSKMLIEKIEILMSNFYQLSSPGLKTIIKKLNTDLENEETLEKFHNNHDQ